MSKKKKGKKKADDLIAGLPDGPIELETLENYKNIWDINPSFKDINLFLSFLRALFLIIATLFFLGSIISISNDFSVAIILASIILFFFMMIHRDSFFSLSFFISSLFKSFFEFNIIKGLKFFILKEDNYTIYIANNDLRFVANRIFKLTSVPDNVRENVNQFLISLSSISVRIPFSYQVVQCPLSKDSHFPAVDSGKSSKVDIYISVHSSLTGILTKRRLLKLKEEIEEYSDTLRSFLVSNYHHFQFTAIHGKGLVNAIRTIVTRRETPASYSDGTNNNGDDDVNFLQVRDYSSLVKLIFEICFLSFFFDSLLILDIPFGNCVIGFVIFSFFYFFLFCRDFLFRLSRKLKIAHQLIELYPFKNMVFYFIKETPDAIFIKTDNLLIETKTLNLLQAHPLDSKYYFPEKFFEAMIYHQKPFTYTLINSSLSFKKFSKTYFKYLNENAKIWVSEKGNGLEGHEWLQIRSGIWKTFLLLSTSRYERVSPQISKNALIESSLLMDYELSKDIKIVKNSFEGSFKNFYLENLSKSRLNSAFVTTFTKNKLYKLAGTHLNYLLFQGKELINPFKIVNEFKKGILSNLGAEFNTPLFLRNDILFGKTINTEFLESEIPAGFTFQQVKNLLILNGSKRDREQLNLKIVSELVKIHIPSIIFDFSGNFSILMNFFEGSQYESDFLHFKLGTSFNINLLNSGLKKEKDNLGYLSLVFDAFGIAMKEDKSVINAFKNSILDNTELDLSSLSLNIQNRQRWEKDFKTESLIQLIRHLPRNNLIVSGKLADKENDFNLEDTLATDKTIIIDLSVQKDTSIKVFFTFILLSKIIHYIENSDNFKEKILVVPGVDSFFDANFLDNKMKDYGKIDKFLDPLIQKDFGLLFSANQARYLHQNIFNYLNNLIVFRSYDKRDISTFMSLLNLRTDKSGIYSSKRKETYQAQYLINMKSNEMLVKRSDIIQPFPCLLECNDLLKLKPLTNKNIAKYMLKQGYDLSISEQRLKVKKTLLEKDFGDFEGFIEEIINFLNAISNIHDIGNLYKRKLKEQLLFYISEKAKKITSNKRHILKMRDEIINILISHQYLVESHPKTAGGSESMMTSYRVGPQFEKALKDYYDTKEKAKRKINLEVLKNESGGDYSLPHGLEFEGKKKSFSKTIEKEIGVFALKVSTMKGLIESNNFNRALSEGKNLLRSFLNTLRADFARNNNYTGNGLTAFLNSLCSNSTFQLNKEELTKFIEQQKSIENSQLDTKSKSTNIYFLLNKILNKLL